jgi:hypothetical protein
LVVFVCGGACGGGAGGRLAQGKSEKVVVIFSIFVFFGFLIFFGKTRLLDKTFEK